MKLMWLGYLICSLANCAMKLYIETDLSLQYASILSPLLSPPPQHLASLQPAIILALILLVSLLKV